MDNTPLIVTLWCLVAATVVIVVLLLRQHAVTRRLRERNAALEGKLRVREEELQHLTSVRLPALAESPRHLVSEVPGPLYQDLSDTQFGQNVQTVLTSLTDIVDRAVSRVDLSAKSTLKSMMRATQSLANEQQLAISDMENRYDDPHVLEDLLKIDHANSQLGRRVQATAVLCGSWPGQQRAASSLTDIVRGATSRIRDYRRVQVHTHIDSAVTSRAVEPVVLAVAEVLDNAARHSQPNTTVEVNFQPAHNGMAIVVDDAGVGMNGEELEKAARLLTARQAIDINRLGDPPQVGFAVIGVLAARYGFTVSVDTRSPYGGVRAVIFLPTALLTQVEDKPEPSPASQSTADPAWPSEHYSASDAPMPGTETPGPRSVAQGPGNYEGYRVPMTNTPSRDSGPRRPPAEATAPAHEEPATQALTVSGLPKRRRRQASEGHTPPAAPAPTAAQPARPPRQTAAGMGAWQRGTRSGRNTGSADSEGNPQA
jgi:two-component sensor histidine kinase